VIHHGIGGRVRKHQEGRFYIGELAVLAVLGVIALVVVLWGWPKYKVYSSELAGQARLKEAEWSKQILIQEAKAQEQASLLQAQAKVTLAKAQGQAEVEHARATAEANRIIGESLRDNEAYLRYLWIQGLKDGTGERIYIPTEAGLPILEAGELKRK
jgi:endonuclease/exonuclease/phosphatase (EEP) superfamily protein YafD